MTDRHKRIAVDNGTDDIISALPRNVIDSILECIPIQDAARTSILSRKWRYIWSAHPHLVLDRHFLNAIFRNKILCANDFVSVISKMLLLHCGPILKFVLYIPDIPYDWGLHINQWLLFLSRNGIKELNLDNRNLNPYKLPSCVFSCPELTHLKLRNCMFKPPNVFAGFHKLISLHLEKIAFAANMFGTLVPSAPLLQNLNFAGCTGIEHFNIHAPKLKAFFATDSCNVKLLCFKSTQNLTVLRITLGKKAEIEGQDRTINLSEFLDNLPRIRKLCFDGFLLKLLAVGTIPGRLSITFNHLQHLKFYKLRFYDGDQMSCVLCLLRGSPNLRKLDIQASAVLDYTMVPDLSYLEAQGCMDLMLKQLRTVNITSIEGLSAELLFIKCILASSPLLETMLVECNGELDVSRRLGILTELTRFSRASPKAEIVYVKPKFIEA